MAKLFTMFLVLIAIQACLIIYTDQTASNTVIWSFINGLTQWGTLPFILSLFGIAAGVGLVGIAAASTFGFKTDFLIFASAIAGFLSLGVVFTNLVQAVSSDLTPRICGEAAGPLSCAPVNLLMALTIGPVALYYAWTVIEWWRGKDY